MGLTETGRWASDKLTEDGQIVVGNLTETGQQVFGLGTAAPTSLLATGTQTFEDVVDELDTTIDMHLSVDDDPASPNDDDWVNNAVDVT